MENFRDTAIGAFIFACIPWILAAGMSSWLTFYIMDHNFQKQLQQEKRMAVYTGIDKPLTEKVKINVTNDGCISISTAEFDGRTILAYFESKCINNPKLVELRWKALSPNNTIIKNGYEHCETPDKEERTECKAAVFHDYDKYDDRISTVQLIVSYL